jgi:hypothetical protein
MGCRPELLVFGAFLRATGHRDIASEMVQLSYDMVFTYPSTGRRDDGHGFRSMASTLLHEQGWNRQVIQRQLAHAERNAARD